MCHGVRYGVVTWRRPEVCKEPRGVCWQVLNCTKRAICVVRCSAKLRNWCYILKLGLRCEQGTADGSAAYGCMCVDAEVGGQLCIVHGVSSLRQAIMLSTTGRMWLADIWRQAGIAA